MALDPLTIATQGLLSTAELIAVQGLLESTTPPTPGDDPSKAGGGSFAHVVPEDYKRKRREMNMRLLILLAASDY